MEWLDMVPVKYIVNILETMFFPKWLQFLATWLNQLPPYNDVRQWYMWWRSLVQEPLIREPVVMGKYEFLQLLHWYEPYY